MKEHVKRMRRKPTDQEKIFAKDKSNKELLAKMLKEQLKPPNRKTNNLINKWSKDFRDTSLKKINRWQLST